MYKAEKNFDDNRYFQIEERTTHSHLARYLVDTSNEAIYDKPADKIAEAIKMMWSDLCGLDEWRLEWIYKHNPELFKLANLYAEVYGSPNRNLLDDINRWAKQEER